MGFIPISYCSSACVSYYVHFNAKFHVFEVVNLLNIRDFHLISLSGFLDFSLSFSDSNYTIFYNDFQSL